MFQSAYNVWLYLLYISFKPNDIPLFDSGIVSGLFSLLICFDSIYSASE